MRLSFNQGFALSDHIKTHLIPRQQGQSGPVSYFSCESTQRPWDGVTVEKTEKPWLEVLLRVHVYEWFICNYSLSLNLQMELLTPTSHCPLINNKHAVLCACM